VPPAELDKAVEAMKEQWTTIGGMAAMLMKDARSIHRLRVSGKIENAHSWQQTSGDQAELKLEMSAVITSFSALMEDEAFIRKTLSEAGGRARDASHRRSRRQPTHARRPRKSGTPHQARRATLRLPGRSDPGQEGPAPELQKLIKEAAEAPAGSPFPFE